MGKVKCVKVKDRPLVYCVDPQTGKVSSYKIDKDVSPADVPPCIIEALFREDAAVFELDIET